MTRTETIKLSSHENVEVNFDELLVKKQYVSWGKKNDVPFHLIDLFKKSATHQGIINSKISYIMSDGFVIEEGSNDEIESFIKNSFSDYDLNEVFDSCTLDLELFNAFAIKGAWNREGTQPSYLEHIDFDSIRPSEDEDVWFYSDDWDSYSQSPEKTGFKPYNVLDLTNRKGEFIIVMKVPSKKSKGQKGIFPTPPYIGALNAIETEIETSLYHKQEIKNGFAGGTIINILDTEPTTEEEIANAKDFKKKVTGAAKAGEVILHYHDTPEGELKVVSLSGNDLDKRYLLLEDNVRDTILRAHSVTSPMLFGIKTEGQLGGATELEISFNIFKKTYITKRQGYINTLANYLLNDVYQIAGRISLAEATLPFSTEDKTQENKTNTTEFANADKELDFVLETFSKFGISCDEIETFERHEVPVDCDNYSEFEAETLTDIFNSVGSITVQNKSANILEMLRRGDRVIDIAQALKLKVVDVMNIIDKLQDDGFLDGVEVTAKGDRLLNIAKVDVSKFEARYTYELRQGIEGPKLIETTRDFCRELIRLNRAYTREEIRQIGDLVGWNVFQRRGGWYTNPKTKQSTPFCRHAWQFILFIKK